jgi:hypothetical protein
MLMEFTEAEQREMITRLKLLGLELGEATAQEMPERTG